MLPLLGLHAAQIFSDQNPSTDQWFYCLNENIINPVLTGGETLRLVTEALDSTGDTKQQIYDNACIVRPFDAPVDLKPGERLSLSLRLNIPDTGPKNAIMGARTFAIRLIGASGDVIPNKNTTFPGAPGANDSDLMLDLGTSFSIGCDIPLNNATLPVIYTLNPDSPTNVFSKKFFGAAIVPAVKYEQPEKHLGMKRTAGLIGITFERLPDNAALRRVYRVGVEFHDDQGATIVRRSAEVAPDDQRNFNLGSVFTHVAIGINSSSEFKPGESGPYLDFTLDDITLTHDPAP